nr:hypothetical protein [uncultured Prevotella sp.]
MIDTFKKTIEDILEGLNFFDFSFFISGFATFFTLMFFMEELFAKTYEYNSVYGVLAAIILIYVCGVVSFSMGKIIRTLIRKYLEKARWNWLKVKSFDELFEEGQKWALENKKKTMPGATTNDLPGQLSFSDQKGMAYSAMWIEIRRKDERGTYYKPLYRQWVMQAVCEGLMFSFLLIILLSVVAIFIKTKEHNSYHLYIASSILAIIGIWGCCREAQRYAENQIKEVIISYYCMMNQN